MLNVRGLVAAGPRSHCGIVGWLLLASAWAVQPNVLSNLAAQTAYKAHNTSTTNEFTRPPQNSPAAADSEPDRRARFADKLRGERIEAFFLADGQHLWYRVFTGDTFETILVELSTGTRRVAYDHGALATALSAQIGTEIDPTRLAAELFAVSDSLLTFRHAGRFWRWDSATKSLILQVGAGPPSVPATAREPREQLYWEARTPHDSDSPDGRWRADIDQHNIVLEDKGSGEKISLTTDGSEDQPYRPPFYWSPDSRRLVAVRVQKAPVRKIYLVESSPADQLQPKLVEVEYDKPGDPIDREQPMLWDIATRSLIPVSSELFANPYDISQIRWADNSQFFSFVYNQRGHQVLRVIRVDAATGAVRAIVDEQSVTFIDYAHKSYLQWLPGDRELIWMSERSGWNHLYLIDAESGSVRYPLTSGEWVVRDIEYWDAEQRQLWLWVSGMQPTEDPYHAHLVRVNVDDQKLTRMTQADGTHEVLFSPHRDYYLDVYSRVDLPPIVELHRASDGSLVAELERADASELLAAGWRAPERFTAPGRDGTTPIYGIIYRPTDFDPQRQYPVIEHIYAGPQSAYVPKAFRVHHGPEAMAELGFIVVQIDGMGTSLRSKKFHDVCSRNLADAGFPDRRAWLKALAAQYSFVDLERVGVYGGSAGGQNAMRALLDHHDIYRVAVADCGCHDNRLDKLWWNELWMGWPVGPHYAASSNVEHAERLDGKLLLIVGELDRNVDPSSTLQVAHALIKANKRFELLVVPGAGHGAAGTPYARRRLREFFVEHLLHQDLAP